jgi:hypothetical protein
MKSVRILQLIAITAASLLLAQCQQHNPVSSFPGAPESGLDATLPA